MNTLLALMILAGPPPVMVELFTSQGCSSCPPADAYLSELGESASEENLILLAYHVDYWDYIGWEDPFANKAYSERQRSYARARGDGRVYTPQMVVNGRTHAVGSSRRTVKEQIAAARKTGNAGTVTLDRKKDGVHVAASLVGKKAVLMVAYVESGMATPVKSGENTGRKLREDFVVRRLQKVAVVASGKPLERVVPVKLEKGWNAKNVALAAFLQDPKTREIYGSAVLRSLE